LFTDRVPDSGKNLHARQTCSFYHLGSETGL
jgi:hypothetical protein